MPSKIVVDCCTQFNEMRPGYSFLSFINEYACYAFMICSILQTFDTLSEKHLKERLSNLLLTDFGENCEKLRNVADNCLALAENFTLG